MAAGGIELLLRCLSRHAWDDIVPVALWNLCALPDELSSQSEEIAMASAKIARRQLTLVSTGEVGDKEGPEEGIPARTHVIKDLLVAATRVEDTGRRERIAELVEMASNNSKSVSVYSTS